MSISDTGLFSSDSEDEPIIKLPAKKIKRKRIKKIRSKNSVSIKDYKGLSLNNLRLSTLSNRTKLSKAKSYKKGGLYKERIKFLNKWDQQYNKKLSFDGINRTVNSYGSNRLKLPTSIPTGLFKKSIKQNYNPNKNNNDSNKSRGKSIAWLYPKLIPKEPYKKVLSYCPICGEHPISWSEHIKSPKHKIKSAKAAARENRLTNREIKFRSRLRKYKPSELGKNGKPKKAYRKSRKTVREEARQDMLKKYINTGLEESMINRSNIKFQPNKESVPIKPSYQYVEDIIEPHYSDQE